MLKSVLLLECEMSFGEYCQKHIKDLEAQIIGLLKCFSPVLTLSTCTFDGFIKGSTFVSVSP